MGMREKLKKILEYIDGVCPSVLSCYNCQHKDVEEGCSILAKVDYLIANGVEIPVHCCDCASCKVIRDNVGAGHWHCKKMYGFPEVDPTDFCSRGERREGE